MNPFTFTLALVALLSLATGQPKGATNFAAVRCCGLGPKCSVRDASRSKFCKPGTWMSAQPQECQADACRYCKLNASRRKMKACLRPPIQKQCFGRSWPFDSSPPSATATGKPRPTKPPTNSGRCSAPGTVVIPASKFPVPQGWVRTADMSGITWKPDGGAGVDAPGSGAFCMDFTPNQSGLQYFTVLSSAPHPTEHNDAWFRFPGGVILYRSNSVFSRPGSEWLKGYENLGNNKIADYIVHKDHDGHQFVMTSKMMGKKATVCVSGRSSKFTIYKLVIITCPPGSDSDVSKCSKSSPYITDKMKNLPNC